MASPKEMSSPSTALFYESLKARGRAEEYRELDGQAVFRGRAGEALACLVAAGILLFAERSTVASRVATAPPP